jgi:hypothetical protein
MSDIIDVNANESCNAAGSGSINRVLIGGMPYSNPFCKLDCITAFDPVSPPFCKLVSALIAPTESVCTP